MPQIEIAEAPIVIGCDTCGRPMRVPIEHVERKVACAHCGALCVVEFDEKDRVIR